MKQGGSQANKTGTGLEKFIKDRLEHENYTFVHPLKFLASRILEQPIYTQQLCVSQTIYDTNRKCDFIIFHPKKHPMCLVIESKWQQSKGSVDEKYPYLVENIRINPYPTIIIIDGSGYKPKALEWLKAQTGGKLLHVFSMSEFQRWANNDENI